MEPFDEQEATRRWIRERIERLAGKRGVQIDEIGNSKIGIEKARRRYSAATSALARHSTRRTDQFGGAILLTKKW